MSDIYTKYNAAPRGIAGIDMPGQIGLKEVNQAKVSFLYNCIFLNICHTQWQQPPSSFVYNVCTQLCRTSWEVVIKRVGTQYTRKAYFGTLGMTSDWQSKIATL